jgi:hypothetical protein
MVGQDLEDLARPHRRKCLGGVDRRVRARLAPKVEDGVDGEGRPDAGDDDGSDRRIVIGTHRQPSRAASRSEPRSERRRHILEALPAAEAATVSML